MFIVALWRNDSRRSVFASYMSKTPTVQFPGEIAKLNRLLLGDSLRLMSAVEVDISLNDPDHIREFNGFPEAPLSIKRRQWTEMIASEVEYRRGNALPQEMSLYDLASGDISRHSLLEARMILAERESSDQKELLEKLVAAAVQLQPMN